MAQEIYQDDLMNRYPDHRFTETVKGDRTYIKFLNHAGVIVGGSSWNTIDPTDRGRALFQLRSDMVKGVNILPILTTEQSHTLPNKVAGLEILNKNRDYIKEYFGAGVWLASDRIVVANNEHEDIIVPGEIVIHDKTSESSIGVKLATRSSSNAIGVIVDALEPHAGAPGRLLTMALPGSIAWILCDGTVHAGDYIMVDDLEAPPGRGNQRARKGKGRGRTRLPANSQEFAIALQQRSGSGSSLIKCLIKANER